MSFKNILRGMCAAMALTAGVAAATTADAADKAKIYLSMSYIGIDWQA